ncbi:MAG TPA: DUF2066 domain-containing protein [Ferrovibrio sp.]|uniref:DUF2066 domain-containing protein n=1 Tax=Ferrovibrio sp. TaxID=1917215 RepID=UPI002ED5EF39
MAVDASADSAAAARPLAIADGQRRAFSQLMRRLTLPEDYGRLPRPTEALLNQTVAGFEIDEERTSATRYIGKITVNFRADAVRRLLQDARLPYSETVSRPVLLIPVWQAPAGEKLWEADNPWRDAWQSRPDGDGLVPLGVAPPSDSAPSLDRLLANSEDLRGFARQQGFEDVLMVSATLKQQDPGNVRIEIYPYHVGGAEFLDRLTTFTSTGGTQEEALLSAAMELSRRIEARWKERTVIDPEKQGQLSAAALFTSLAEWNKLRSALAAVPVVRKVKVLRLSHHDAQLLIAFYGEPNQLAVALAQRDVQLEQNGGFWELRGRQP